MHQIALVVCVLFISVLAAGELLWCGKPYDTYPEVTKTKSILNDQAIWQPELKPYMNEKVGRIWTMLGKSLVADDISCTLELQGKSNSSRVKVISFEQQQTTGRVIATIELESLPFGAVSSVRCSIKNGQSVLNTGTAQIGRYPYKSNAVQINTIKRSVIVDNEPFLPFGFYLEYDRWQRGGRNFSRAMYFEVANGFNTPLPYRSGSPDRIMESGYLDFLNEADAMGLKVHFNMYGTGMEQPSESKTATVNRYLDLIKDHPALLAYYIADEPDGDGTGIDPAWVADTAAIIRSRDPYHPISIVLNCVDNPYRTVNDYAQYADIVMSDPYPIGLRNQVGCDLCKGTVEDVADRAAFFTAQVPQGKPFWMVPQAFGGEQHWDRQPSAREIRVMTYLSLIGGARGIQYFILGALIHEYNQGTHFEPRDSLWSECRRLALETADLAPALLNDDGSVSVVVETPTSGVYASAHFEIERNTLTVLVANSINAPQTLILRLLGRTLYLYQAQVLFEQRSIKLSNPTVVNDMIDALGTRAYRFVLQGSSAPENLITNPSFETQTQTGIPNSFLYTYGIGGSVLAESKYAVTGYYSLRLVHPGVVTENAISYVAASSFLNSRVTGGRVYEASVMAKGKTEGLQAAVSTCFGRNTVSLSTTWRSFMVLGRAVNDTLCNVSFELLQQGTAWIDDVLLQQTV